MRDITDIDKFIDDLERFDPHGELLTIIEDNLDTLTDMQRDQWLEGRGVDGEYIRPYYSENPYFKSKDAAARYASWKQKISYNPQRPADVPNLFINGFLHQSMAAKLVGDYFEMDSDASFAEDVFDVHKNAQGLDEEKRLLFAETITLPEFLKSLLEKTGIES